MSSARRFAVTPPDLRLPWLIVVAVVLICVGALALGWRELQGSPALWLTLAVTVLAPALLMVALFRRQVVLEDGTLRIVAGINQTRVPLASIRLDDARIVDLDTHPEYRPGIKTFGSSMPGYHAGHFRQVGGKKVFAMVTDKHRVLVLPEQDGRLLLLSLEKPQALLDALRQAALHQAANRA